MARRLLRVSLLLLTGCTYTGFEDLHVVADSERDALVAAAPRPDLAPALSSEDPPSLEKQPDGSMIAKLTLREALRLALRNNIEFLKQGEGLGLQLLSLEVLRHAWGPALGPLSGSVGYSGAPGTAHTNAESATVALSQKLPWGGSASASWSHSGSQPDGDHSYQGTASLSYTQPLLKGAGHRAAIEEIVAGSRGYAYARRTFDFARVSLLINTVDAYFKVLQQRLSITNFERNLERKRALYRQAEIREKFGQVTRTDVFRSQVEVTQAESALEAARATLSIALDAFKVDLGIPAGAGIELAPEKVEFRPLELTVDDAVAAAEASNPGWLTLVDQMDDARRALAIASRSTLPQVDLTTSYSWATNSVDTPGGDYETGDRSWALTASFSIPLDRTAQDRDYQVAVTTFRQREREFARAKDNLVRDVRQKMIQLRQIEQNVTLQKRAGEDAEKVVKLAEFDYQRGRASNRDVIDAQGRLLEAQNAYQGALVSARIQQLQLLQFVGKLTIDEQGDWIK